ncbi:MAG: citrate lyase subunit alpha [Deltaproteobacteria bacterium]|jgi:citrate lyase subunit alpha/citrate CoA-transferase|nr:citrate lyase subunit alpha [Deltaproteobacteria bacterium]
MKNAIGREIPGETKGQGKLRPFLGAFQGAPETLPKPPPKKRSPPGGSKVFSSLGDLFGDLELKSGATVSFHHHLRDGDAVANMVLAAADKFGLRDLNVSLTGTFAVHAPMIELVKKGVVASLRTSSLYGPVAGAVSRGVFPTPVLIHTHGGRPRAMKNGELRVDAAFVAAPAADCRGNIVGHLGKSACGSLGYAWSDADHAGTVVAVTDNLVPFPLVPPSIPQNKVDRVVAVESLGDPRGIVSGTTRITKDPVALKIAASAAEVISASGLLKEGFSFQTGAGGASLAAARYVAQMMEKDKIRGGFALGGITAHMVGMLERGLFQCLYDVQSFDLESVRSLGRNQNHLEIGADLYANPHSSGCLVDDLDAVILGATEIDLDFNVNVVTGSDGVIMGAAGGHPDTAAGAKLTIVVANLLRSRQPIVVDRVITATTPGETVDVLVTERGVAVNPKNQELKERLVKARLEVKEIDELKSLAEKIAGAPEKIDRDGPVVALVEYRDGTIIDVVRGVSG